MGPGKVRKAYLVQSMRLVTEPCKTVTPVQVLGISGSLRARSSSSELLHALALGNTAAVRVRLYRGLAELPHFNPDLDAEGLELPVTVAQLHEQVATADALVIASPEYAHGVPGSLKNALDWLVSGPDMPGKPVGVLSASSYSSHARASLVETLRTMSAHVVEGAVRVVPLDGRRLYAAEISSDPDLAGILREVVDALSHAVHERRRAG